MINSELQKRQTTQLTTLTNKVFEVIKNYPAGFTLNFETMQLVNSGYVAAYKETQNCFGMEGLKRVIEYALTVGSNIIGGWYNKDNGQFYYDCSKVFTNLNDAAMFGIDNEQIAIFDLNKETEIKLS